MIQSAGAIPGKKPTLERLLVDHSPTLAAGIEMFLQKINDIFKGYIRDLDAKRSDATGESIGFDILF